MVEIQANSGHATDIQDAIHLAAAEHEKTVWVPEGTSNFYEIGETWSPVTVDLSLFPSGINLLGAPTQRNIYGQVVDWKTVLTMPYDVPGNDTIGIPQWFVVQGRANPSELFRMSDIQLKGYREFDPASVTHHTGVRIWSALDFRIDHCSFRSTCGGAVQPWGQGAYGYKIQGLIDHCEAININGIPAPYATRTVDYGFFPNRSSANQEWDDNLDNVLGKYTDYTVFIEDCYLEKWRHCVATYGGTHYVFRRNIIKNDFAYGSIDVHGMQSPVIAGRAIEVYENQLLDPAGFDNFSDAIYVRGGSAVIFNNMVTGYRNFAYLSRESDMEKCWPHDIWIWNNTLPTGVSPVTVYVDPVKGAPIEGVDYFLYPKLGYAPYQYPHPLTGATPIPPSAIPLLALGIPAAVILWWLLR